jgi:hypothetical protein
VQLLLIPTLRSLCVHHLGPPPVIEHEVNPPLHGSAGGYAKTKIARYDFLRSRLDRSFVGHRGRSRWESRRDDATVEAGKQKISHAA